MNVELSQTEIDHLLDLLTKMAIPMTLEAAGHFRSIVEKLRPPMVWTEAEKQAFRDNIPTPIVERRYDAGPEIVWQDGKRAVL